MSETVRLVLTIVQVIVSLVLILTVIFQSGKQAGLSGSINGVADTFFGKNKARSLDAKLEPVSYTHLDVYKRQKLSSSWAFLMRIVCMKSALATMSV